MIRIENLCKTFHAGTLNENRSMQGISLEVKNNEFLTIIGGNGAGKSTLLNLIAGTILPDEGTIHIGERNVTKSPEHVRAAWIGRVFQDPLIGTAAKLTIEENLALASRRQQGRSFGLAVKQSARADFREQLAQLELGLEDRMSDEIGRLSGGQRQAITLLMATITKPDVVLLDEHTAALDPKTANLVMELSCKIIAKQKLAAIMITHNMEHALAYGDRLVKLEQGKIAKEFSNSEKASLSPGLLTQKFAGFSQA